MNTARLDDLPLDRNFKNSVEGDLRRLRGTEETNPRLLDRKFHEFATVQLSDDQHFVGGLDRDAKFNFAQVRQRVRKRIQAQTESIFFKAIVQFAQMENSPMHRATSPLGRKKSAPQPLKIRRFPAIDFYLYHLGRRQVQRALRQFLDGLRQIVRRIKAKRDINSRQMFAVKRVKFGVVCRTVFRTVPPAPIASFAGEQRLLCFGQGLRSWCARAAFLMRNLGFAKSLASIPQKFPRRDVVLASKPAV